MAHAADPPGAEGNFTGLGLRGRDEVRHAIPGRVGWYDDEEMRPVERCDRLQILDRVERKLLVEMGLQAHVRIVQFEQRVAVSR